jgi:predicted O-linked N-acetylglucosamine transferase (SPINDLY family)
MRNAISMSSLGRNGRFGNQIFQYFFLRVYGLQRGLHVLTPEDWIGRRLYGLNDATIPEPWPTWIDDKYDIAESPTLNLRQSLVNVDLWGYFQFHTSFYAPHRDFFRSIFKPVAPVREVLDAAWEKLKSRGKTIIGLHIRRGDYEDLHQNPHHLIATTDMLRQWLREIWPRFEQPVLYLCSDALNQLLPEFKEFSPVTERDLGPGVDWAGYMVDFDMLCRCNVVGISNSTFSFLPCMLSEQGGEFYRPTFDGRMERFDPWNAPVLLRREKQLNVQAAVSAINDFKKQPRPDTCEVAIRTARREAVEAWWETPRELLERVMATTLGQIHAGLISVKVRDEPTPPDYADAAADLAVVEKLKQAIAAGPENPMFLQSLIAAPLMVRAHDLPLAKTLQPIPKWLQEYVLKYVAEQPQVFYEIGETDRYHHFLSDWISEVHRQYQEFPDLPRWQTALVLFAQIVNMIPLYFAAESVRQAHHRRAQLVEATLKFMGHQLEFVPGPRQTHRKKIRLGILAAHFGPQTETYHSLPYYEHIDREKFEVILLTPQVSEHPMHKYCASRADRVVGLQGGIPEQVATLRREDLDVMVVATNVGALLNKITPLAAHQVARVQVTLFSSPVTTGLQHMDYYISGTLSETADAQEHYTEKLIKLEGCGFCYQYKALPPPTATPQTRAEFGISPDAVVFASGANYYKVIPETINLWASIIAATENSVLLLYPFGPAWNDKYDFNPFLYQIYRVFAEHGLGSERLVVLHSQPDRTAVKECLKQCDIYLDSLRHAGGHSLVDPLEVGLPTISIEGPFLRSRHGAAILRSLNLPELVAKDEVDYKRLAVELGRDAPLRERRREQVNKAMRNNPEFLDSKKFAELIGPVYVRLFKDVMAKE